MTDDGTQQAAEGGTAQVAVGGSSQEAASARRPRGRLRVYLGAAPGVGKTYAMLDEGRRRLVRGVDVVVALVETHGRAHTAALLDGLEVLPRRTLEHRGATFTEMDVDAVLARRPGLALVDELAHTNVPGCRNAKRWQDVRDLLDAGIDVVTTVNIQHLESLNDVVASITGVRQLETIPDAELRRADQIELVDMSPEALRRRLAHGNVYPADKVDASLAHYFRLGNLTALRELALLWTADRVEDALEAYRREQGIVEQWPSRERLVVAVTAGPESETLIRRAARIATRTSSGELFALHVLRGDGLAGVAPDSVERCRSLAEQLGGTWHTVLADDVAEAVVDFARGANATQIVLGATRRSRLAAVVSPGVAPAVIRAAEDIDVLVVTHEHAGSVGRVPAPRGLLTRRRRVAGWVLALGGPPALALALDSAGGGEELPIVLMLYLALTVGVALVGGLLPALAAAMVGGLLSNFLFAPPVRTLTISDPQNAVAIGVLCAVAIAVSAVVDLAARRTLEASRARAEADALAAVAGTVVRGGDDVVATMLEQLRTTLHLRAVALVLVDGRSREVLRVAGAQPDGAPEHALALEEGLELTLHGRTLLGMELRLATAVGHHVRAVREHDRLRAEAARTRAERDRGVMRTALLAAVSHDLRTPLAAIKAGVTALRTSRADIPLSDQDDLLADVDEQSDRLQLLIDNLLDMSRLDAGAVATHPDLVALDELIPRAVDSVPAGSVELDVPETLPLVRADAGLVERALANLVENAVRHAPQGTAVRVTAQQVGAGLVVRVVDHGPGVPDARKPELFVAFQRLGDSPHGVGGGVGHGNGVGLGLAVAKGFVEVNGGTLEAEDTPGGGLTMVLTLPLPAAGAGPESVGDAADAPCSGRSR